MHLQSWLNVWVERGGEGEVRRGGGGLLEAALCHGGGGEGIKCPGRPGWWLAGEGLSCGSFSTPAQSHFRLSPKLMRLQLHPGCTLHQIGEKTRREMSFL